MTGEISLKGKVLPVGGIKEKILAAERSGMHRVLIPKRNEKDLIDVPTETKRRLEILGVDDVMNVLKIMGLVQERAKI
jgi:ATP-dependent Lon protease